MLKHGITFLFFFPRALLFRRKRRKPSFRSSNSRKDTVDWLGPRVPKGLLRRHSTSVSHAEQIGPYLQLF